MTNRDKKGSIRGRMADTGEPFNVARRKTEAATGFFDDLPTPESAPPRRHHPWEPPEAELPGTVPVDTILLGRTDQVVVALTGMSAFSAGIARQVAKYNVTINGLLPGPFLTDRLRSGIEFEARRQNISFEEMLAKRSATNPTGRVGDPAEFGDACAFLCAASSGFIVGQNLLLDGGAFNSTMG